MHRLHPLLMSAVLIACPPPEPPPSSSTHGTADDLPDPTDAVEDTYCDDLVLSDITEEWEQYDESYYYIATHQWFGAFTVSEDGETVEGYEEFRFYPKPEWSDEGEPDCIGYWDVVGVVSEPSDCVTCQWRFTMDRFLRTDLTTCPKSLWNNDANILDYNVRVSDEGTADFYFADSMEWVGSGHGHDSAATFATEPACKFH